MYDTMDLIGQFPNIAKVTMELFICLWLNIRLTSASQVWDIYKGY